MCVLCSLVHTLCSRDGFHIIRCSPRTRCQSDLEHTSYYGSVCTMHLILVVVFFLWHLGLWWHLLSDLPVVTKQLIFKVKVPKKCHRDTQINGEATHNNCYRFSDNNSTKQSVCPRKTGKVRNITVRYLCPPLLCYSRRHKAENVIVTYLCVSATIVPTLRDTSYEVNLSTYRSAAHNPQALTTQHNHHQHRQQQQDSVIIQHENYATHASLLVVIDHCSFH